MPYDRLLRHRQLELGATYHVCFCTRHRARLLRNQVAGSIAAKAIEQQSAFGHCISHAWVVMPDHVHWLLTVTGSRSLAQVVGACKADSARQLKEVGLVRSSPWQVGYYEHRLRDDEDLRTQARYLIANPLRAGMVSRLADYPWWYARWASPPHGPSIPAATGEDLLWS